MNSRQLLRISVIAVTIGTISAHSVQARTPRDRRGRAARTLPVHPLELVDRHHALKPTHAPDDLVDVPVELGLSGRRLRPLPLAYFSELSDAVWRRFGRRIVIASGYRSHEEQSRLFDRYVESGVRRGMAPDKARELANTYSAIAGHSEHQLGTTIDIRDEDERRLLRGPDQDPELQRWLRRNAYRFGFINSYPPHSRDPKGKPYRSATYRKTGYIVEPWHWRFVGKRAAKYHHRQEIKRRRRISTHEFVEELSRKPRLRRRLDRPHPADKGTLRRFERRLRELEQDRGRDLQALRPKLRSSL